MFGQNGIIHWVGIKSLPTTLAITQHSFPFLRGTQSTRFHELACPHCSQFNISGWGRGGYGGIYSRNKSHGNRQMENANLIKHRQKINHLPSPWWSGHCYFSALWSPVNAPQFWERLSFAFRARHEGILQYSSLGLLAEKQARFCHIIFCTSAGITHHLWIYAKANTIWWLCMKLSGVLTFEM